MIYKLKTIEKTMVCIILTLVMGCGQKSNVKTIKLAHGLDVSHPVHVAMEFMADRVEEKSKGTLKIDIYPSQQLGTERECLELLQIGSLGMTKVSTGVLENFAPGMKVFGLPFLFRDREHYYNVLDSDLGQELLGEGKKYWLKGIAYYDAGSRSFYTINKPIHTPEDLKGLKIRVQESASSIDMVKALGGSPTPVSWGELYTALQQGIVDGAENNPPSFYLSHHYEVCKYYTIDEHTYLPDVLVMSTVVWDQLSEEERKWLQDGVEESVKYQRTLWQKAEKDAIEAVKADGVEVIYPDKQLFSSKVEEMYDSYGSEARMNSLIQKIKNTK
ncbi:TRAP transporter substrate-binding protein [Fulvivirga sediminis]|uniref:TRAP transporter substrate-binding protein n=1 Tax=Fulvivirga sediminis TaxID=2803949 RepID=A0A937F727_9BACT|nr:TRAP transporter substrate-binding protein [Fulvivirga sediminis]MBL3656227.1 TRAP transporter substrate-binding protein [Fulvivirga sediminis]